jgi:dienelactone hydrolase
MIVGQHISYELEGITYIGYLALPEGSDTAPGVLVCHEGPGISENTFTKADRLAALGFVAFALDYHGGGKMVPLEDMMTKLMALITSPDETVKRAKAGLNVLLSQPRVDTSRIAAIGYCFGGTMCLELVRAGTDLAAIVGFHSGLSTSTKVAPGAITAKALVCIGADDPMIPPDQRIAFEKEMTDAKADWRMNVYGGAQHSFTNPGADGSRPGILYDKNADERSWQAMRDIFAEVF